MSIQLSYPSTCKTNKIDGFERFHNTKLFIGSLSTVSQTFSKLDNREKRILREMAVACNYSKMDKFLLHKAD